LSYLSSVQIGSGLIGLFLDSKRMSRRARAFGGWILLFVTVFAIWGGNYACVHLVDFPSSSAQG
jgi:hypothetical protein